jgi:uncharacterized protein (TIGR00369 family)
MEVPELYLPKVQENKMCFGCGKANPMGLKVKLYRDGEVARAEFVPGEYHQGWPGYMHGGVLMALVDECIGYSTFMSGIYTVTAKIEVRLKSMAAIGDPLTASARVTKKTKRLLEIQADVRRKDGSLVAEASSIQFVVK